MGLTASFLQLLTTTAGGVAEVAGAYTQSEAIRAQGAVASRFRRTQAAWAEAQARDALRRGHLEESRVRQATKQMIGTQRARLAAGGVFVGGGSAMDLQRETAALGAIDAMTARNNAFREALGYEREALTLEYESDEVRRASRAKARLTLATGGVEFLRGTAGGITDFAESPYVTRAAETRARARGVASQVTTAAQRTMPRFRF